MRHILAIFLLLTSIAACAQEATIRRVELTNSIAASKYPMTDLNGRTAALVIVQVMADNVEFTGSVLNGGVVRKTGEYWVYMGVGAKELHIHSDKFLPVEIRFPDYGIPRLESAATYVVTLALARNDAQNADRRQKVEIKFSPSDAIVLIDGQIINTSGDVATAVLPADRDYSFTVTKRGYIAQQGTFHLHASAPARMNIELTPNSLATQTGNQQINPGHTIFKDYTDNALYCDGEYRYEEHGNFEKLPNIFYTNETQSVNRNHFAINLKYKPERNHKPIIVLSHGWRILQAWIDDNWKLQISTNNQRNYYKTGITVKTNEWNPLNIEFSDGRLIVNGNVITNVELDLINGDNALTSQNFSNGTAFQGWLSNIEVINYSD